MTHTPDTALAARLAAMMEPALQYDSVQDEFHGALDAAYRSCQLITLADHTAAVAKAVEASDKALQDALAYIDKGRHGMARNILAAAIRARKGDAL